MYRSQNHAGVAEMADAQDLGSCGATRGGSNPFARTKTLDVTVIYKSPVC